MPSWNTQIKKGDTFNGVEFEINVNAAPKDLTGAAIKVQFRESSKTGIVKKTIEIGSGITVTDAVNGIFNINPFLITFSAKKHYYDIQITDVSGVVKTYVEGYFDIVQDITV